MQYRPRRSSKSRRVLVSAAALALGALLSGAASLQADPLGWRGDGSGSYDTAAPALEWGPERNVVWKTKLPSWSNALPVRAGDRIFLLSEPSTIVCVSAEDGAILWQHDNDILDTLEAEKAAEVRRLREEMASVPGAIKDADAKLRKARQAIKENPEDVDAAAEVQSLTEQLADLKRQWAPVAQYDPPSTHSLTGYTSGTPVTDGEHVWLLLGNGVVACYDLEGNRRWIRFVDPSVLGYGHSSSPVLSAGKVIVLHKELVALDPATGADVWRCPSPARWGTPLPLRVGELDVIITPSGQAVDAADGRELAKGMPNLQYSSPMRDGDVIYFVDEAVRAAYRVPEAPGEDGKLTFTELWKFPQKTDRYYASPVIHEGLLYCITQRGELTAWDIATGDVALEQKVDLGGTVYPSPVLAGGHLFLSSDSGAVQVAKPGPQWEPIAKNTLEASRSTPVFIGDRMIVRGLTHVWCIAAQAEETSDAGE